MAELKIITMRDVKPEPVEYLWKPYLPAGKISLIQGDPGSGKTTMSLAIAAAVTQGRGLPGGYCEFPADVIVQNAEDGLADTIIPRLIQCGADVGLVHFIDEEEAALSLSDERIEQAIIEKKAKLCLLDPIQAYFRGSDMNSAKGVRPLMKHLAGVADRTGCAIVLVGHLNKKGGRSQYRGLAASTSTPLPGVS
jgi:RecA-family ATPase